MTVKCIECEHFSFGRKDEDDRTMAKNGFGLCEEIPDMMYAGARFPRECVLFQAEDAAVVEKRVTWLEGKPWQK